MANLGVRAAWLLFGVLLLVAVIGFEQGFVRAFATTRDDEASGTALRANAERDPVPRAQPLPAMDEATVRRIAREEAEAAIARSRPRKPAPTPNATGPSDDAGAHAPAAAPPATAPASPAARPVPSPGPSLGGLPPD